MSVRSISRVTALGLGPRRGGFSLIEVVIALSIVALTFIGIVGLLGVGAANDETSSQQTVATTIAQSILADLRSTPPYNTTSTRFGLKLPTKPATPGTTSAPLAGVSPSYYLYFDNSPSLLPLSAPAAYTTAPAVAPTGAVYLASVYETQIWLSGPGSVTTTHPPSVSGTMTSLMQSNDMVRVVVTWPAQGASTASGGNVDIVSQFLIQ